MKIIIRAVAIAVVALLGLALPASAGQGERPIRGTLVGEVNFLPNEDCPALPGLPPHLQTQAAGVGLVSHLGKTTMTSTHCSPAGAEIAGRMILTAADGSELWMDYAGTCDPLGPDSVPGETVVTCESPFSFAGGTGRFTDVEGTGHLTASVTFMGLGAQGWPGVWTLTGSLAY